MIALDLQNIRKIYRIYQYPAQRLKEIILRRPFHTEFAALENINFSVSKGETFGIIGENGAGKSTLLKILAKTLKPTSGNILIHGRSAALLELGAGFNPELTGEENIYLNAYLMGLTKKEIEAKKDEIIDFSELGDFIKRPVKTYSSGMHVRLAFSIATSVDPEILIIDEALSVGDQHFQKKCIDRMMQFKNEGKTIFFCSHSLYLVQELCNRSMWLKNGKMEMLGKTSQVINAYNDWCRAREAGMSSSHGEAVPAQSSVSDRKIWIEKVTITDDEGHELEEMEIVTSGSDLWMKILIRMQDPSEVCQGFIGIAVNRNDEEPVFGVTTKMDGYKSIRFYDHQEVSIKFTAFPLLSGRYYFIAVLSDEHALHPYDIQRTRMISVENLSGELGMVKLEHNWHITTSIKENGGR